MLLYPSATLAGTDGPRSSKHSLAAFFVERRLSVFGVYILGGLLVMFAPLLDLQLTHLAFQAIVYWTVAMSGVWFAAKALGVLRRGHGLESKRG